MEDEIRQQLNSDDDPAVVIDEAQLSKLIHRAEVLQVYSVLLSGGSVRRPAALAHGSVEPPLFANVAWTSSTNRESL